MFKFRLRKKVFTFHITLFVLFCFKDVTCLASSDTTPTPNNHHQNFQIVSTNKNGGHSKVFNFNHYGEDFDSTTKEKQEQQVALLNTKPKQVYQQIQSALRSTFLPSGYPTKTPDGYLQYSIWSWIQDISTQLRGVLATQRVLEGVGVGREGATALSALMNYLVRDGCGMVATLLFTFVASSKFRTDIKRWRLFADLMVDIGITLEVAAVSVSPIFFLPMICIGNMCKAVCGVAAGACGGSINLHWATGSDISDINAKFGAQHTVTGALGLIFAAYFAQSVSNVNQYYLWILYSALTVLHIFANIRCMRLIAFNSFNNVRMDLILNQFLKWWDDVGSKSDDNDITSNLRTPIEVAKIEPLFFIFRPFKFIKSLFSSKGTTATKISLYFGDTFNDFSSRSNKSISDLKDTIIQMSSSSSTLSRKPNNAEEADEYIISSGWTTKNYDGDKKNRRRRRRRPCVSVAFLTNASPVTEAKAYLHAQLLMRHLKAVTAVGESNTIDDDSRLIAEKKTLEELKVVWKKFHLSCSTVGWDLRKTELRTLGYELELSNMTAN